MRGTRHGTSSSAPSPLHALPLLSVLCVIVVVSSTVIPVFGATVDVSWGYDTSEAQQIKVKVGDTVRWNFDQPGPPHSVTAYGGLFDSGLLYPGDSFSYTFNAPADVDYYCEPHPFMQGSVSATCEGPQTKKKCKKKCEKKGKAFRKLKLLSNGCYKCRCKNV